MESAPRDGASSIAPYTKHHRHGHWVAEHKAQRLITTIQFAYPILLLVFFLFTFSLRSILLAKNDGPDDATTEQQLGPGGKPLPKKKTVQDTTNDFLDFSRPRKLLFQWLALGAALTFVGNAITVIVHALYARSEDWWCGQAAVVSHLFSCLLFPNHSELSISSFTGIHCRCFHGLYSDPHLYLRH